jgi:hypothetical protein
MGVADRELPLVVPQVGNDNARNLGLLACDGGLFQNGWSGSSQ